MPRKHGQPTNGNAPVANPAAPDTARASADSLPARPTTGTSSAGPGPLLFVIGINRADHVLTFTGNAASENDLELLREALQMAQANVVKELLAAAEARGAAAATQRRVLLGDEVAAP